MGGIFDTGYWTPLWERTSSACLACGLGREMPYKQVCVDRLPAKMPVRRELPIPNRGRHNLWVKRHIFNFGQMAVVFECRATLCKNNRRVTSRFPCFVGPNCEAE